MGRTITYDSKGNDITCMKEFDSLDNPCSVCKQNCDLMELTNEEMHLELKANEIVDNPFDTILHYSIELTRELLFACHRFKSKDTLPQNCTSMYRISSYYNSIIEELSKLSNMSDETVSMCKETSFYYPNENLDYANKILLHLDDLMETVWSRCVPDRNDRFEQIRLGINSNEYKRILRLRDLIDNSEDFKNINEPYLCSLCDVIQVCNSTLTDLENNVPIVSFEKKKQIIEKYSLTINDVEYMISYLKAKNNLVGRYQCNE